MTSQSCFPVQENELECLWPLNCQNSLKEEERICQIEKAIGILKTAQAMRLKGLGSFLVQTVVEDIAQG